jgi:hypothetical protein
LISDLSFLAVNSRSMQFHIDCISEKKVPSPRISGMNPGFFEGIEPIPATFSTGSVACGKRHRFVQKEQLCVAARRHHGVSTALEFKQTSNPTPARVLANDLTFFIV